MQSLSDEECEYLAVVINSWLGWLILYEHLANVLDTRQFVLKRHTRRRESQILLHIIVIPAFGVHGFQLVQCRLIQSNYAVIRQCE